MSKWIIDKQSGTIMQADDCVIVDDATLSEEDNLVLDMGDSDAETIEVAKRRGTPVLHYKNPDQVHISWDAEDVQTLSMNMTDEQALEALQKVSKHLRDRSIEYGWEVLEMLLAMDGYEVTIDEEKD